LTAPDGSAASAPGLRPVFLAFGLVAALSLLPWVRAVWDPPPGRAFVGFFYYVNDQYNYLSFVQQAEDGALLFENKLFQGPQRPVLVNLEWWLVGRMSALLGHRPALAYRLFGLLATMALLVGIDRWLRYGGLPDAHRLPALLLVALGGGLGGPRFVAGGVPIQECLDLYTGLFPFIGIFANAHFVAGTALLLFALLAFARARDPRGWATAAALGTALGLVRPYDLVMLVVARAVAVALTEPPGAWIARLLPLAGLTPVVAYNYWVFYLSPAFAFYTRAPYQFPPLLDFLPALLPAVLLGATALLDRGTEPATRGARRHLLAWAAIGLLVVLARPVLFSLQFLVGLGLPLLALGALSLVRLRPAATAGAALAFGVTALLAVGLLLLPNTYYFVPAERLEAARLLRSACRKGDVALTPADIGQYVVGLTACRAFVSHEIAPEHAERAALVTAFYTQAALGADERAALLDSLGVAHVLLPEDAGAAPRAWLGEKAPFERVAVVGSPGQALSLYSRTGLPRPTP
jgi:hypothetical protein